MYDCDAYATDRARTGGKAIGLKWRGAAIEEGGERLERMLGKISTERAGAPVALMSGGADAVAVGPPCWPVWSWRRRQGEIRSCAFAEYLCGTGTQEAPCRR